MKKTILMLLLAVMNTGAMAEWLEIGKSNGIAFYFDPATIRKNGNFRRVWELYDHEQRHDSGAMSRRILWEYDCKEERFRFLSFSTQSEAMAKGRVLHSESTPSGWRYIPPDSAASVMHSIVCQ